MKDARVFRLHVSLLHISIAYNSNYLCLNARGETLVQAKFVSSSLQSNNTSIKNLREQQVTAQSGPSFILASVNKMTLYGLLTSTVEWSPQVVAKLGTIESRP